MAALVAPIGLHDLFLRIKKPGAGPGLRGLIADVGEGAPSPVLSATMDELARI